MAVDKKVEIVLTADGSGVAKGVAVAQTALGKLQTQLGAMEGVASKAFVFAGLGGIGVAATAAAAGMVALVKSAADYGDQLDAMSQRTGVAVEELSKLQYAAKLSDTSSEALGKGLGYLSRLMIAAAGGAEQSAKLFDKFGVSVRNQDGTIDMGDYGCNGSSDPIEGANPGCSDGKDNDGDSLIDAADTEGCLSPYDNDEIGAARKSIALLKRVLGDQ